MAGPTQDPREESIGDLLNRLVDDARAYARAEIELVRKIARHRAAKARTGLILLAVGGILIFASLLALVFGLVLELALWIGPLVAGLLLSAILAGTGALMLRVGLRGVRGLAGDDEERAAIRRGENLT